MTRVVIVPTAEQIRFYLDDREDLIGRLWSAAKDKDGCATAPWYPGSTMMRKAFDAFCSFPEVASSKRVYRFEPVGVDMNQVGAS